jgi:hypothetical protein
MALNLCTKHFAYFEMDTLFFLKILRRILRIVEHYLSAKNKKKVKGKNTSYHGPWAFSKKAILGFF